MSEKEALKPVIGITLGDVNGVGPEVILKALQDKRIANIYTPVIYASGSLFSHYRKLLNIEDFKFQRANSIEKIHHGRINVIECWPEQINVNPGQNLPEGGTYAFKSLMAACTDLRDGKISAVVTAPINKSNIQNDEFDFPGHTEFLAEFFDAENSLMFLVSGGLRVGVVTGHIPISEIAAQITTKNIEQKLKAMIKSLKEDFGIQKPRVAVLGLNPHAGDNGLLGKEEIDVINPLIQKYRQNGNLVFGPFPADGFFGGGFQNKYDGVLAMYHDQGLIPFKTLAFHNGVNFTAGLPVVRTSPDHGTGYDIAGKNQASAQSMTDALFMAVDIVRQRK